MEYTVTIPLEDYRDLIQAQRENDNLIEYIFGVADYDYEKNDIDFDEQSIYLIQIYLKNIWSYTYKKKIDCLKNKYLDEQNKYTKPED